MSCQEREAQLDDICCCSITVSPLMRESKAGFVHPAEVEAEGE